MMSLCFSGCSITWGDELVHRQTERFSTVVSDHYGVRHVNLSEKGISNDAIVRRTITYLQKNKPDIVVMQFTVHQRIEYITRLAQLELWTPQRRDYVLAKQYYLNMYNDVWGCENLWKNIFLFDSFCKSVGQKYVSIIADHYEPIIAKPFQYYQNSTEGAEVRKKGYWRSLMGDYNPVLMHRHILGVQEVNPDHYSMRHKGGHPTAKAHKIIADKIIELIDAI